MQGHIPRLKALCASSGNGTEFHRPMFLRSIMGLELEPRGSWVVWWYAGGGQASLPCGSHGPGLRPRDKHDLPRRAARRGVAVHTVTALPRPATTVALCGAQLATARPRVPGGAATAPYAANPAACEPIATVCVTRRLVSYDAAFSGRAYRLLDELRRNSARLSSQS
jgi:hypothetical protein